MTIIDGGLSMFWKKKKKKEKLSAEDIPLPPSKEELPEFPSPKEVEEKVTPEEAEVPESSEEKIAKKQKRSLKEMRKHKLKKPLFLEVETYQGILEELSHVKNKLNESTDFIETLKEFKSDEDKAFKDWQKQMSDIQEKLVYVDETLFKKGEK